MRSARRSSDSRDLGLGFALLLRNDELVDFGLLDKRIEYVEDAICAPNLAPWSNNNSRAREIQAAHLATIG